VFLMAQQRIAFVVALLLVGTALVAVGAGPVRAQGAAVLTPQTWMYPEEAVDQRAPVNGCGSQGDDGIDVPDQIGSVSFTDACNWHDRCYGTCGLSQGYCDRGMLAKTRDACGDDGVCTGIAKVYFLGVATFGGDAYWDGQRDGCKRDPRRDGRAHGDPHLVTLDGTPYSFMAAGEFAMVRDDAGTDLVQARFYPQDDAFTVVSGVAVRLGVREVVVQQDPTTSVVSVYVDGEAVTREMAAFEEGLVELGTAVPGTQQVIGVRGWDGLQVEAVVHPGRMDLSVHVPEARWGGTSGLLGDADGDPANDLVDRDGTLLSSLEAWTQVYDEVFKEAYRVRPADSMFLTDGSGFDYHGDDITSYPRQLLTLDAFATDELEQARQRCAAAGLDADLLETCTFDVLVSGDERYADQAARSATRAAAITDPQGGRDGTTPGDEVVLVARPPLVEAVETGDIDEVRRLLDGGEDVDVGRESDGLTPLVAALVTSQTEIVDVLLDAGANPNAFSDQQMAPLQLAIVVGQEVDTIRRLLDAGADPNTGTEQGGAGSYLTPLGAAAATSNLELAALLLDRGADVDGSDLADLDGITPLYLAAAQSDTEMMTLLLERGADPNGTWGRGGAFGPLYAAALSGNADVVRQLLDAGADRASASPEGFDIALLVQDEEILRLLGR
jgi:ankyrin repeat protein